MTYQFAYTFAVLGEANGVTSSAQPWSKPMIGRGSAGALARKKGELDVK